MNIQNQDPYVVADQNDMQLTTVITADGRNWHSPPPDTVLELTIRSSETDTGAKIALRRDQIADLMYILIEALTA